MTVAVLESKHERDLADAVKEAGGLAIKLPASLYRGIPDRLLLLPGGRVFFVELKRLRGKPSVHQVRFRKILLHLGMNHDIIEGPEQLQAWIDKHVK